MNRSLFAIVLAALITAAITTTAGPAFAQEESGVSIGVKAWINDWTHDVPGAGSVTSDTTTLFGPTIEATFDSGLFLEGSYLVSLADYDFGPGSGTFSRGDAEGLLGYYFVPGVGILAGYKYITLEDKSAGIKDTVSGPLIGIRGIGRLDRTLSLYGTVEYLFTDFKETDPTGSFKETSPGWVLEFGLKAYFTPVISGNLGYKFETNKGNDSSVRDSFSGLTLGMQVGF